MIRRGLVLFAVCAVSSGTALAGDRALIVAVDRGVGPVADASRAAASGAPGRVQVHYDSARDLQEGLRSAAPFSRSCHPLGGWASRYAAAEVAAAEALDRLQPSRAARLRRDAAAARFRVGSARRSCRPGDPLRRGTLPALLEPRPGAASFGRIVARAPAGADAAVLFANGSQAGAMAVAGGLARARLSGPAGRYDLEVRFRRGGTTIATARSAGVWLLPGGADAPSRPANADAALQSRVRAAAEGFPGVAAVWVHDLGSGRAAAWNAAALFPAASTVKLGVMVEALRRMGPQPERSALFHDVAAMGGWSSNLASNRLLRRVGGSGPVRVALVRMGATASTFTGPYIVATERPRVDAPEPPPRVSGRVTTAFDLGAVLRTLHEAAAGDASALARTRLSRVQARLALGVLLSSEASGDNTGLFRGALGPAVPAAQKHGWISSARHSAAVIYSARGPVVVSVLTYRPGLTRTAAARLGASVVAAVAGP